MPRDLLIKMDEKRQGYMFILEGGSISWCSKKSDCFSLSTMKYEYIACTAAVQEAIWLRNYLLCLDVTKHAYETTVIYCDNTAAILFFSTNIIPWAVQRTDHDLLLGEGMYRDKMVGEVGTNTFHSNPYRCGWTRLHAKTVYSNIFSLTAPSTYFSIPLLLSQSITNRILAIHVRLASIFDFARVDSSGMLGLLVAFLCSSSFCADTFDPLLSYTAPSAYYDRYPESLGRRGSSQTSTK